MVLKFFTDPQTGVIVPPVTVFNGGAKQSRRRNTKIKTKKTKTNKRKTHTRKQKISSRKRKTMRR